MIWKTIVAMRANIANDAKNPCAPILLINGKAITDRIRTENAAVTNEKPRTQSGFVSATWAIKLELSPEVYVNPKMKTITEATSTYPKSMKKTANPSKIQLINDPNTRPIFLPVTWTT